MKYLNKTYILTVETIRISTSAPKVSILSYSTTSTFRFRPKTQTARKGDENGKTKMVQQQQQGKWTTWEDVKQRSFSWRWKTSLLRHAIAKRSVYKQLPSRNNFQEFGGKRQIWTLFRNRDTAPCAQQLPLPTVGIPGQRAKPFEKSVRVQNQQSSKQTRERLQISK